MAKASMPAPKLWQALRALDQLSVLRAVRETPAVRAFCDMGSALLTKDIQRASEAKAKLDGALLTPARRICGDVWQDFVLHSLIFIANDFQTLAANGEVSPFAASVMAHDLGLLQAAFCCGAQALNAEAKALCMLMEAPADDVIAVMAGVAWGGGEVRGDARKRQPLGIMPLTFDEWLYDPPEFEAAYACDEMLESIYRRFCTQSDWAKLRVPLEQMYATYGTGEFLLTAAFCYTSSGMRPYCAEAEPWEALLAIEQVKNTLMEDALKFLHGEAVCHVWIHGESGMGKSALIGSLAQTLGTLRLVHIPPDASLDPMPLVEMLGAQPLHFLLCIDDTTPDAPELKRLCQCLRACGRRNIMLVATSRHAPQGTFFERTLCLSTPTLRALIEIVLDMARRRGMELDYDSVQNAAIDAQRERGDLSLHMAARLCEKLMMH